jgi:hypothetical protein
MRRAAGKASGGLQNGFLRGELDDLVGPLASQLINSFAGEPFECGLTLGLELVMAGPFGEVLGVRAVIQEALRKELIEDLGAEPIALLEPAQREIRSPKVIQNGTESYSCHAGHPFLICRSYKEIYTKTRGRARYGTELSGDGWQTLPRLVNPPPPNVEAAVGTSRYRGHRVGGRRQL